MMQTIQKRFKNDSKTIQKRFKIDSKFGAAGSAGAGRDSAGSGAIRPDSITVQEEVAHVRTVEVSHVCVFAQSCDSRENDCTRISLHDSSDWLSCVAATVFLIVWQRGKWKGVWLLVVKPITPRSTRVGACQWFLGWLGDEQQYQR